ncbi:hypothetical protein [Pseudomonas viciae]|jgi:hypothetical protein|uniref:hypothetical protein n=1 Tax=Pseudomonas viciae TaxID=2505979 RepID=UPI00223488C5|nr:hypothetical protein [Pseudomonas viciae]UZE86802.1 hypothetical protein LOY66_01515 [Pseudomonas viciae]
MSDLLSASSLLLAIAAILFSLWYSEISKALDVMPAKFKEDNAGNYRLVKDVLYGKALPVAAMAVFIALIFLPDAIKITIESFVLFCASSTRATYAYDAVRTAYCFVSVLSIILAFYMIGLTVRLCGLCKKLK